MENVSLVVTSISNQNNSILKRLAKDSSQNNITFIVIGDLKSITGFTLPGCDYYSIDNQKSLNFQIVEKLPFNHYARKNIGYLIAISQGSQIIIETDDDNLPLRNFWNNRYVKATANLLENKNWVNVYKYFTEFNIWPRGFPLENIKDELPSLNDRLIVQCPIQQGLTDKNPDVDAIYRLTMPLPFSFNKEANIALGNNSICPFNSQNTTWFKEAFPLLYLPSYCNFRMTDIWRSFVAQRIAWTCGWSILFHNCTMVQERNAHNLMDDFRDEISGYKYNSVLISNLKKLNLKPGVENIPENMIDCYSKLIDLKLVDKRELVILGKWLNDIYLLI